MAYKNVTDRYREWEIDLIRDDLKKNSFPYAVLMENWQGDFNFGQCVRNGNAFGAREVYYLGRRRYDRRATVGTHHYTDVIHVPGFEELLRLKDTYTFIGIDNMEGSVPLETFQWPKMPLMVFGEEGYGLTPEIIKHCDALVSITQHGSVRSVNAGTASGIVMHYFVNKFIGVI